DSSQGSVTQGTMSMQSVYNYPMTANSTLATAPLYTSKTDTWADMDTSAAVTYYSVNSSANPRTTTITMPNGTKSKTTSYNTSDWTDGLLYKTELLSSSNAVLNKSEMSWQQGDYNSTRLSQILSTDEKSQVSKQTFTYGTNYNQVTEANEYGYGSTVYRKTATTYQNSTNYTGTYSGTKWMSGRHIFNLPLTAEIKTGGNSRLSYMAYNYDTGTLTNRTSIPNYDQTYNPSSGTYDSSTAYRGNVTLTTTYENAAALTGAISYDYTYDIAGNNITATTNCCQQISTSYTSATQYAYPASVTRGSSDVNSPDRVTTSAVYDYNTGAVTSSTDANGRTTTATYDSVTRPTQVTLSTGGKSVYEYFESTLTSKQTAYLADNTIVSQGTAIVNGRGQTRISKLLTGTSSETATQAKYDAMGRQSQVSNPYPATSSPTNWTTYTYDTQSRVTQVTAPDGSTSKTFYNETTSPSSAASNTGNTVRSQDAWGRERWARTDAFGRLTEVVEPDANGTGGVYAAGNMQTGYTYDELDQLTQVNQGVQVRKFKYDSLGRMTRQKLAEQTATINDAGSYVGAGGIWSDSFVYDARSNLTQRTDARGVKTNFSYLKNGSTDPLNRLHAITFDTGGADTTYTINSSPNITYDYMTTGDKERIQAVTAAGVSTETYAYDIEGRVSSYTMVLAARTGYPMYTNYLYDTANRLTEVRYPGQFGVMGNLRKVVNVAYDQTSRLKELKVDSAIQMNNIAYNDFGQATSIAIGASTANPITETYSFDGQTGLMTNQKVKRGATSLMDLSYEYNRGLSKGTLNGTTGQLTHIIDNLDRNKDRVYEFDTLGRLNKAKGGAATGASATANWTQDYGYDRYGNKQATANAGYTANYQAIPLDGIASQSFDTTSNRINEAGYQYDKAGNLIRGKAPDGNWQRFEYDSAGRLVKIKNDAGTLLEEYTYGASRERLRKEANNQRTYYAWGGSSVLMEYFETTTALTWAKSYIYAGSRLLSTITNTAGTEVTEYHHPDRLGTRIISNPVGATQVEQNTLPFGT
ncbi:MAG: hypothetical protein ACR2MD_05845, partial [Aridibacter sp.]